MTRCAPEDSTWLTCLPGGWRDMVIEPLDFRQYREYEMAAGRTFGYDVDGLTCYYAHSYALTQSCSDNDEDFYEVIAYGETVHAWRLRDDRWLIHRVIQTDVDCPPGRGFFTFAESHPV